jgi:hypothetical protein
MRGKGLRGQAAYLPLISEKADAMLNKKKMRVNRKKAVAHAVHYLTGMKQHKAHKSLNDWEPRYG